MCVTAEIPKDCEFDFTKNPQNFLHVTAAFPSLDNVDT